MIYNLDTPSKEIKKLYLDELAFWAFINEPPDHFDKFSFYFFKFMLAGKYAEIGENHKAINILLPLLDNNIQELSQHISIPKEIFVTLSYGVELWIMSNYSNLNKHDDLIKLFPKFKHVQLGTNEIIPDDFGFNIFLALKESIELCSDIKNLSVDFIYKSMKEIDLTNISLLSDLIDLFRSIGMILYKQYPSISVDSFLSIPSIDSKDTLLWESLKNLSLVEFLFKSDKEKALQVIDDSIQRLKDTKLEKSIIVAHFLEFKGDIFFSQNDNTNAVNYYNDSSKYMNQETFHYGWVNYHLGLSSTEYEESFKAFKRALSYFSKNGLNTNYKQKILGEIAILHFKNNNYKKFISVCSYFIQEYYENKNEAYAPFVALICAMMTGYNMDKKGNDIETSENLYFPLIERGIFEQLNLSAKPNPEATVTLTYYILSQMCSNIAYKNKEIYYAQKAFSEMNPTSINESECGGLWLIISTALKGGYIEKIFTNLDKFINILITSEKDKKMINQFLFDANEYLISTGEVSVNEYTKFINYILNIIENSDYGDKEWWLAEVYLRKAGFIGVTKQQDFDYNYLKKAYKASELSLNYSKLALISEQLILYKSDCINNINEYFEYQLNYILATAKISQSSNDYERVGNNLFLIWRQPPFSVLYDIYEKIHIRAVFLNDFPQSFRAAIMILFILGKGKKINDKEYLKVKEWAISVIKRAKSLKS